MRRTVVLVLGLALVGAPAAHGSGPWDRGGRGEGQHGKLAIRVLSNDARLISGGDALVEITLPARARVRDLRVRLDAGKVDRDVTSAFARRPDGRLQGLVTGLRVGRNELEASLSRRWSRQDRGRRTRIVITNHPSSGPVFAGPQVQPWICRTEQAGLGPATDASCSAPTQYSFFYRSTASNTFVPYDVAHPPADALIARTTTDEGRTVPYIVRRERGVIDRGIYDIAVLFDPARPWTATARQRAWNGKLYWKFGGDCNPNHLQTPAAGVGTTVLDDLALSRGFAVATSTLNVGGLNCNHVVSAEAVMMTKEHFIEAYGQVRYTLSVGSSGGSMMQHWIASAYPGLLDGIMPSASYPDIWTTTWEATDCGLLLRYFRERSPHLWSDAGQRRAVEGHNFNVCDQWVDITAFDSTWLQPDKAFGCLGGLTNRPESDGPAPAWVYDPVSNPSGVRCTLQDYQVAMLGGRPQDGFANRPYDNVGLQYGLKALQSGAISAEQFVDLNEKIGGRDIDFRWQPQRSVADPKAVERAYRTGVVTTPREAAKVPILDLRGVPCDRPVADIHTCFHTWEMRARLIEANGHADNQVVLYGAPADYPLTLIDRWVAAIKADTSRAPLEVKVRRHKPADALHSCWEDGQRITNWSRCEALNPYYGDPRLAAGSPLQHNIVKCRLMRLRRSDYAVAFTNRQWARLQAAFPTGVCDWSKGRRESERTVPWLSYEDGPGGRPLGSPVWSVG
jgi:hypothetical protein